MGVSGLSVSIGEVRRHVVAAIRPLFAIVCWGLWIASFVYLLLDNHHVQNLLLTAYNSLILVYSWVKGESLFETHVSNVRERVPDSLLRIPASTYVGVRDARSASDWYIDKLGMRKLALSAEGTVTLKFKAEDKPLILVPRDKYYPRPTPMLYTSKIPKGHTTLMFATLRATLSRFRRSLREP